MPSAIDTFFPYPDVVQAVSQGYVLREGVPSRVLYQALDLLHVSKEPEIRINLKRTVIYAVRDSKSGVSMALEVVPGKITKSLSRLIRRAFGYRRPRLVPRDKPEPAPEPVPKAIAPEPAPTGSINDTRPNGRTTGDHLEEWPDQHREF